MRRGASATGPAAATVILTGLVILLYLLFLPPAEREAILGNASPTTTSDPTIIAPGDKLLTVFPRIVEPIEQRTHNIPLASFILHSRSEERKLATYRDVSLLSSRSDKMILSREISFDSQYTFSNQIVVLNVERLNAPIMVFWNDQRVYYSQPRPGTIVISDFGQIGWSNRIRIEIAEPKWYQIFRTNEALLSSVEVIARIHDSKDQESQQTFVLSKDQVDNIESAHLRFYSRCTERPGQLLIRQNGQLLQSQSPDCNRDQQVQLDPSIMSEGRNTLDYVIGSGVLHIDSPTVYLTLKRPLEPLYYFEIEPEQWEGLLNEKKKGMFEMLFVRGTGQKDIDMIINGRTIRIDTTEDRFIREITTYLREGENYIKLQPRRRAETVQLNIYLISAR